MMIAALNKWWRPLTHKEFWHKMSVKSTNEAMQIACVAGLPQEIFDKIFVKEGDYGLHWE